MRKFVLDTSVLLKWFSEFGESDLDRALQLRDSMLAGTVFFHRARFSIPQIIGLWGR
jgi:hypothetical protein